MKFIDLFAGIGGFRLGMESAGHECVGFVEIDKHARKSYKAIHNTKGEFEGHDITAITDDAVRPIGSVDVICGGFPCQAFSIAGKRRGFEDTRGTLFFEIARFASILRPRLLFLENVKGLLNHNNGDTFETIIRALDELGYDLEWQVFNSKYFGVPQNRGRVFIIGHLRGERTGKVFPFGGESESVRKEYKINIVGSTKREHQTSLGQREVVYDGKGIVGTLTATDYKGPKQILIKEATSKGYAEAYPGDSVNISHPNSETRRGRVGKQLANTLLTGEEQGVVTDHYRIRKLTPRECWRLQGFPDWAFDRASEVNSNSQLYKQAGNSVTVNVIAAIAKRLEETK
ncbi:DNA (cytosine-5-)-methyltransferase [Listeria monocytogenes]|uniref:DNA cytosine methyltransferase n=1 Tax=Listeria monocytogenes TaxID=1639 RepID=UPI001243DEBD|nr:DNA (cytosine-5-)-methyltransferase [Listeria monocytogenes]KAA9492930.1 DNA (cytosine-5-)-methyltransferase [Listeria monocytogenes]MCM8889314.1 DNA (cytosine-5-)-methyltransferase [Listeria monocytogenes]